jgi:hypothetical protein
MSKQASLTTKCPCGADISFDVAKPNLTTPVISKATCLTCESRFMFKTIKLNKDEMSVLPELLFLSQKARTKIADKIKAKHLEGEEA